VAPVPKDQTARQPFVLAVDDEEHITELLAMALGYHGFEVERAASGRAALAAVERRRPDLIVLDVMLPDLDGFDVARRLRQSEGAGTRVPVIFLTARDTTADKVEGLRLGTDDYVTKPFSIEELVERVKAVLRRFQPKDAGGVAAEAARVLERGKLRLDPERHTCHWDGHPVMLTVTEFLILQALATRPGVVKTRDALMDAAYDDQVYVDDRTIDSHIKRLRKKFKQADDAFDVIETLYGVGYRFKEA
jgi:two-component system response regulator ChvI